MGFAFRMMIWVITFNLAVGIVIFAFGQQNWLNDTSPNAANVGLDQTSSLQTSAGVGAGVPVEESSFWYRFLDIISLGFYNKISVFLNSTIFSIPALFVQIGIMPIGIQPYINGVIILIFVMGMFEIFTGKDLTIR